MTLSDKISGKRRGIQEVLYVKDVKEFIKELKEEMETIPHLECEHSLMKLIDSTIDKLAWKELI